MTLYEATILGIVEGVTEFLPVSSTAHIALTSQIMGLPQDDFIRIHRSYIVSLDGIESFTHEYVMVNKHELPISRSHKEDVLQRLA